MATTSSKRSSGLSPEPWKLVPPVKEWGPERYGISVRINAVGAGFDVPAVIDVEDDEKGNFVGLGLYGGGYECFYFTELDVHTKEMLGRIPFVAHNGKSDLHKLRAWGVNVRPEQLVFDTMIASYVMDSTKESHGLKELARQELSIQYPAYRELCGKGAKKRTLADLPVELVAAYNAMDCIATYKLWKLYDKQMVAHQRQYFEELELPVTRLLYRMEQEGIKVDLPYLADLDKRFNCESARLLTVLRRFCGPDFNPSSPKQVAERLFPLIDCNETKTGKEVLQGLAGIPLAQALVRYRETTKLSGTYTEPLSRLGAISDEERIHTTFNQVAMLANGDFKGIRTGRLSSSDPNLHNIPTRTKAGELLRRAFISRPGTVLVCADYSQIEWRLAAHFSEDPRMIEAVAKGDVYTDVANKAKISRRDAKTAMLAMNFGAGGYKIAAVLKRSPNEGFAFVRAYEETFPQYFRWRNKIASQPHIETIFGRRIKPESDHLKVPYMVQGSAADIIKQAMLLLDKAGLFTLLQVHDELLFELPEAEAEAAVPKIREIMENIVKLRVPLVVEPGIGSTWKDAK